MLIPTPRYETLYLHDDGEIPNNADLAVIIYRGASTGENAETDFRRFLHQNSWGDIWINGVYDYHHYHSTAHEFLGILEGEARLKLGGAQGKVVTLYRGDAVVLPAGTGHKNEGSSKDFKVIGAYPDGQQYDMNTGVPEERPRALDNIRGLPRPKLDPLYGLVGPVKVVWGGS